MRARGGDAVRSGMSRNTNMPVSTLVRRVIEVSAEENTLAAGKYLKLPSGKHFKVTPIDANERVG